MNVVTPRVARGLKRHRGSLGESKKERTRLKEQKKGEVLRDIPLARTSSKRKEKSRRPKRTERSQSVLLKETESVPRQWRLSTLQQGEIIGGTNISGWSTLWTGPLSIFQSIDDNFASIFYEFMPLHINLCIDLQFIYFIDFVFLLTLLGVQPAR